MDPSIRYTMTSDGVRIAYAVHGEGPPLVFVRGWISHLDLMWDDPEFRAWMLALGHEFTVVRYDVRGNGLSDRQVVGRLQLDQLVNDLEAVVDRAGFDRATFLATCYGGPILARYASRHPDRVERVILDGTYASGPELGTNELRESVLGMVRLLERQPGAAHAMLDWFTHPEPSDLRQQRLDRTRHAIRADVAAELYELSFDLDVTADLAGLRVPTLVTHRTGSRAVPYSLGQRVAAIVPDAELVPLDGSAHNPWEGDGGQPLRAIAAFTARPVDLAFSAHPRIRPVVILFTDMEGSTAATIRMGDQSAQQLVRVHHDVVSRALQSHGGTRVKGTGDGMLAEFTSVSSAIHAALEIQHALHEHNVANPDSAVPLRIGINAGEAVSELDDLYGQVVNAASRICDQARAGEVIVSNVVRELAAGKGFRFEELGPFDLRGMSEPVRLYRVG